MRAYLHVQPLHYLPKGKGEYLEMAMAEYQSNLEMKKVTGNVKILITRI